LTINGLSKRKTVNTNEICGNLLDLRCPILQVQRDVQRTSFLHVHFSSSYCMYENPAIQ